MRVIDRRLNPKSKSLGNRQRFIRRAKADIREQASPPDQGFRICPAPQTTASGQWVNQTVLGRPQQSYLLMIQPVTQSQPQV